MGILVLSTVLLQLKILHEKNMYIHKPLTVSVEMHTFIAAVL